VFKKKRWSGLNGDSYVCKENSIVVFVAFYGSVGLVSIGAEHNRTRIGSDIGGGIDGSGNCAYYDGCWGAGWYSVCHPWVFADNTEFILVPAK